jgi:DNA invertase Pin-like site-specific DNA recombinase
MKLGYGRVSTNEQDTAAQVSALKSAGCEISGKGVGWSMG